MRIFYLFIILCFFSCSNNQNKNNESSSGDKEIDSLYNVVMAKHDEVMPKITNIKNYQMILRADLENADNPKDIKEKKEVILKLVNKLQKGDDAMFDWMNNFKNKHLNAEFYTKTKKDQIIKYLKEEEDKIDAVAMLMLEGIGEAEIFLKKTPK
jgi:hypothetical protein